MTRLAKHPGLAPPGPVARASAVKWGRSLLDMRFHAIDELADHPAGRYRAECGHVLLALTLLRDIPLGATCETCATRTRRPADHLWRALPGEPICADGALDPTTDRYCLLVDGHGRDVEHAGPDGQTWGAA